MISAELLERVAAAVTPAANEDDLRRRFPGVRITVCSDDDIPARVPAVSETAAARFYYIDAGGPAWRRPAPVAPCRWALRFLRCAA